MNVYGNYGYGAGYGAGYGYEQEACGCGGYQYGGCYGGGNTFAIILVLFILLAIIGCTCYKPHKH